MLPMSQRMDVINEIMLVNSENTCQIVSTLPYPIDGEDQLRALEYVQNLNRLSQNLPPSIFVCNGEDIPFISTCI
jgi:hypothetical protein